MHKVLTILIIGLCSLMPLNASFAVGAMNQLSKEAGVYIPVKPKATKPIKAPKRLKKHQNMEHPIGTMLLIVGGIIGLVSVLPLMVFIVSLVLSLSTGAVPLLLAFFIGIGMWGVSLLMSAIGGGIVLGNILNYPINSLYTSRGIAWVWTILYGLYTLGALRALITFLINPVLGGISIVISFTFSLALFILFLMLIIKSSKRIEEEGLK